MVFFESSMKRCLFRSTRHDRKQFQLDRTSSLEPVNPRLWIVGRADLQHSGESPDDFAQKVLKSTGETGAFAIEKSALPNELVIRRLDPVQMKRIMDLMIETPKEKLRVIGFVAILMGLVVFWFISG